MKISKYDAKKYALGAMAMTALLIVPKVGEWISGVISSAREKVTGLVTR